MTTPSEAVPQTDDLIAGLTQPAAYPHPVEGEVEVHETHISVVFLAGDFAYKVKKSVKTDFLDYSTLALRKHYCEEEVRLDGRYASDLYMGVVPIGWQDGKLWIGTSANPIEYAVKMRRFPDGALLSERLAAGKLTSYEVRQLAEVVAEFHRNAPICEQEFAVDWPNYVSANVDHLLMQLRHHASHDTLATLSTLQSWSDKYLAEHSLAFKSRIDSGFIRECHGDLHLANVVHWGDQLVPFDGIEFNERLRWIDVLSDAAFLAMDLAARDHLGLSRSFTNAYLERSGDYGSLVTLRWYLLYRALVRAMVASIRAGQNDLTDSERRSAVQEAHEHIQLAYRYTLKESPRLWITYGVSGSGKTTLSELFVQRHEAFRLRSDIERKRLFRLSATERPTPPQQAEMYSEQANERTYARLEELASSILQAGYSVIIDATFLKRRCRQRFHELAKREGISLEILDCHSDEQTLRQRVADRMAENEDASDADVKVLEYQLASREPLTDAERELMVDVPDLVRVAERL